MVVVFCYQPREVGRKHIKDDKRRGNPVYLMFVPIYLHQPVVQLLMRTTPEMYDEVKMADRMRELAIPTVALRKCKGEQD